MLLGHDREGVAALHGIGLPLGHVGLVGDDLLIEDDRTLVEERQFVLGDLLVGGGIGHHAVLELEHAGGDGADDHGHVLGALVEPQRVAVGRRLAGAGRGVALGGHGQGRGNPGFDPAGPCGIDEVDIDDFRGGQGGDRHMAAGGVERLVGLRQGFAHRATLGIERGQAGTGVGIEGNEHGIGGLSITLNIFEGSEHLLGSQHGHHGGDG